jgi:microcystin-dependent protein
LIPTGLISPYGAEAAPLGWLLCDGFAVSRSTYADLFAVIGETYGAGNGSSTFNLPDLQQRFPLGLATSGTGASMADTGGAIDHVHDLDSSSSHARITLGGTGDGIARIRRKDGLGSYSTTVGIDGGGVIAGASDTTGAELSGDSDTENPPFQVVQYIIKT